MAENVESIVLEHLRHIRKVVDVIQLDILDFKSRVTGLEVVMAQIVSLLAAQSGWMDRMEERLARLERRLELADA